MIADPVLQDALEKHGEFFRRPVAILLGKLHHGILHDVEGAFFVTNGIGRLPEGAALYRGEKIRQFALCCQRGFLQEIMGLAACCEPLCLDQTKPNR
jgi:hypothetical protein